MIKNNPAHEIEQILANSNFSEISSVMKSLIDIGNNMSVEEGEKLIEKNPVLLRHRDIVSKLYETYIFDAEKLALIDLLNSPICEEKIYSQISSFGKNVYNRVHAMFEYIDFSSCKNFVLVGCGALPATIFHVYDRFEIPKIVGLDNRTSVIRSFQTIVDKFKLENVYPIEFDGKDFDYSDFDIVYIANLVTPKKGVLDRIAETAASNVKVIMRDPYSVGRLWTESGSNNLNKKFNIMDCGGYEPAYFSHDVFLEIK